MTSVFPDSKRATDVLPLKKSVRRSEGLSAGSRPTIDLVVVHDGHDGTAGERPGESVGIADVQFRHD